MLTPDPEPTFVKVSSFTNVTQPKLTRDCLTGPLWSYRGVEIDTLLPRMQPLHVASVSVYQSQNPKGITIRGMAEATLNAAPETLLEISNLLKERKYTLSLPSIETAVQRIHGSRTSGQSATGHANLAFVDGAGEDVFVLRFYYFGGWNACLFPLSFDHEWHQDVFLLVGNLDAPTLTAFAY